MSNQPRVTKEIGSKLIQGGLPVNNQVLRFNTTTNQWEFFTLVPAPTQTNFVMGCIYVSNVVPATTVFGTWAQRSAMTATETSLSLPVPSAVVFSRMLLEISSNTLDVVSTVVFRDEFVDGNQTFTIGVALSGIFQDITNTDSVAASDHYNFSLAVPAGTGSITVNGSTIEGLI